MPARNPPQTAPASTIVSSQERYVIPNLRNACRILKFLGSTDEGFKAADIGRRLGIPVTTTLRIMTTLHLEGFVRKNGTQFELGPVLIQLGNASLAGTEIRTAALPVLEKLTGQIDETSHLAIPCDDRSLIVAVQDSPHPLRAASRPGFLAELHCSSTGKTFLAFLHQDRLAELYPNMRLTKRTAHTLTTLNEIRREAEVTREARIQSGRRRIQSRGALPRRAGLRLRRNLCRGDRHHRRHRPFHQGAHSGNGRRREGRRRRTLPASWLQRHAPMRRSGLVQLLYQLITGSDRPTRSPFQNP